MSGVDTASSVPRGPILTAPMLTTERFELWRPASGDLPDLCRLLADDATRRYLGNISPDAQSQFERLQRHAGGWALYGYGMFYVRAKGGGEIVGQCGVFHSLRGFGAELGMDDVPEAGWIVRADHCGQGVAREVMQAALAWFDEHHGLRRIACMIEAGNTPSERLATRLGFVPYAARQSDDASRPAALVLLERAPSGQSFK